MQFAIPAKNKIGSGITYIVGANNSGKTSLLEALYIKHGDCLSESDKHLDPAEFKFYCRDQEDPIFTIKLEHKYRLIQTPWHVNKNSFEMISSKRDWNYIVTRDVQSSYADTPYIPEATIKNESLRLQKENCEVAYFIHQLVLQNNERYDEFKRLVTKVFPDFGGFDIKFENKPYVVYTLNNEVYHAANFLGSGIISVIRILIHLFESSRNNPVIIDEPEQSLHPGAQKALIKIIAEYSQKRQIIISTHSPNFISWEYIKNGAKLNKIVKYNNFSKIYTLDNPNVYAQLINSDHWAQPFLLDEVAKEIFFINDKILFLEGQEDVGLLRREIFTNTDIHIFGYGVRGCDNFKCALRIAADLGLKKVAAILDGGEREKEN